MWLTQGRVEIYMKKLLFKTTHFTKIYSNSHGFFCLTETKFQIYFITLSHINPVNYKSMEDQTAYDKERPNLHADYIRNDTKLKYHCTIYYI